MLTVAFLYAALCDPHFDRREAAELRLLRLIDRHPAIYGPRLGEWCRGATCPEIRSRTLRILAGYERWRVASYVPATAPVWPICDCWPVACPVIPFGLEDVRDRCAVPVDSTCKGSVYPAPDYTRGPHWHRYRATTERAIRERLRAGATWEECDAMLSRMWSLEQRAKHDCGASLRLAGWQGGYLP